MRRGILTALLLLGACLEPPNYDGRPCAPGRRCPDQFTCHVGGVCRRACSAQAPCPLIEHVCASGVCVPRSPLDEPGKGGPCQGVDRVCIVPPEPECIGDVYRTYASAGTCDAATNTCFYAVNDVPCTSCTTSCLEPCRALTCDDLQGGCRVNGRCEPNGVGGVECVYEPMSDGLTCAKPGGGSGVCNGGICGDCTHDRECEAADKCVTGSRCVAGTCTAGERTTCTEPPDACHEATGTCNASTGRCEYAPVLDGTTCDDDDMCTTAGSCQRGVCVGSGSVVCEDGDVCTDDSCDPVTGCVFTPNTAPCNDGDLCTYGDRCGAGACSGTLVNCDDEECLDRECNGTAQCNETPKPTTVLCGTDGNACTVDRCDGGGRCVHLAVANGSSCGPDSADRCCSGACVDVSSDPDNCGGCNVACAPGLACESVAVTNSCASAPANTSGRCRCQMANAQCPIGQICRTVSPFTDRCTPPAATACAPGTSLVAIGSCPDYCTY